MLTKTFLEGIRKNALRRGVWYTALDRVERGILVLTSRLFDEVQSMVLGVEIVKILAKLKDALKSRFVRHMEEYGVKEARRISGQAAALGSVLGDAWAHDFGFIRYLTFLDLNRPSGWGLH